MKSIVKIFESTLVRDGTGLNHGNFLAALQRDNKVKTSSTNAQGNKYIAHLVREDSRVQSRVNRDDELPVGLPPPGSGATRASGRVQKQAAAQAEEEEEEGDGTKKTKT